MANLDRNSQGGAFATSGSGTGGAGAGGQGSPWVNIQNYLNNSQGSTATSDILNNQVGGALRGEQDKFNKAATDTTTAADKAATNPFVSFSGVDPNSPTKDAYSNPASYQLDSSGLNSTVDRAANRSNEGNTATDRTNLVNSMGGYNGPKSFTWGSDPVAQNFMKGVTNPDTFQKNYLPELYQENAGQGFTPGQAALQSNIDANNPNVKQAFQGLNTKYGGLANDEQTKISGVNKQIGNDQTRVGVQSGLVKNGLGNYQNKNLGDITSQVNTDEGYRTGAISNEPSRENYWNNQALQNQSKIDDITNQYNQNSFSKVTPMDPDYQGINTYQSNLATDNANKQPLDFSTAFTNNNVGGVDTQKNDYNYIASLLGQDPTKNIGYDKSPYDTTKLKGYSDGTLF